MIVGTPSALKDSVNMISDELKKELERKRLEKEEEELMKKLEIDRQREKAERKEGLRKRKEQASKLFEKTDEELAAYSATIISRKPGEDIKKVPISGGLWTDDDLVELTRLTKKYPGGSVDRWEIIAEAMGRNVSEVTFMAYKLKDNIYQTPGETDKLVDNINKEIQKKVKTKATEQVTSEKTWTQEQQKALEAAIQKYPKKGNEDRWVKIANSVPGKTKEECQTRYKYLVELVKKQKEEKEKEQLIEEPVIETQEIIEEEPIAIQNDNGGKKRNKRKEKKKNVDFYADSDEDENFSD